MSYLDIAAMAASNALALRATACLAVEGEDEPQRWASENSWRLAAQPGWADAWTYGAATYNDPDLDLGLKEDVITDYMILSAVQAIRASESS